MAGIKTAVAVAMLAFSCLAAVPAHADTVGTSVGGGAYKFGSDIAGYLDISQDICDIAAAVDAGNLADAEKIYTEGKNSVRSTGAVRKLQEWATSGEEDEPHWGLYSRYFGNDSDWVDTFVLAGLEGAKPWTTDDARAQVVKKGTQANLLVAYMFHEVDEGEEGVEEGSTDSATGAPHVVDEAAAIYFSSSCPGGSIANVADKRAFVWGTLVKAADGTCTAATNVAAGEALAMMQSAAQSGDVEMYEQGAKQLEKAIVTIFIQATQTYANKLGPLVEAGNATEEESAEGVAFFRTIAPLVAQVSEDDAAAITAALATPTSSTGTKVQEAFKATIEAYGITAEELGSQGSTGECDAGSTTVTTSDDSSATSAAAAGVTASAAAGAGLAVLGAMLLL